MQSLANKWHGSACSKVAFNNLHIVSLGHELNIEGPGDTKGFSNPAGVSLNLPDGLDIQLLRRKDNRRISTVDTSIFQMLTDGVVQDLTVVGNCIEFNFLSIDDKLGHHNRFVSCDICG